MNDDKKIRLLIISQYFYPEIFRINDICKELVNLGYDVTVLTGVPNYPEGRIYKGYDNKKVRTEEIFGAKVIRLPIRPRYQGKINLIRNYFSYSRLGARWAKKNKEKFDLIYVYEISPLTMVKPALIVSKQMKTPMVFHILDLWPETLIYMGIKFKPIIWYYERYNKKACCSSDLVLTTSKSIKDKVLSYSLPKNKVVFWPQYYEEIYRPVERTDIKELFNLDPNSFKIIFTGNLGEAQGLDTVIKAMALNKGNVDLILVGDGRDKERLQNLSIDLNVNDRVHFIGRRPVEDMPRFLAFADVAYISLKPGIISNMVIPAKLQSYMACKMPILASAGGELADIIMQSNSGLVVPSGDVKELSVAINEFSNMSKEKLAELAQNSYYYATNNFEKEKLINQLNEMFNSIVKKR